MDMADKISQSGWRAQLDLEFERRETRSVLASKRHDGPLVVQKSLYPEGEGICHAIVVHPPAGIAGGDYLGLSVGAGVESHAVLATPGAGKWYRSSGDWARQIIRFELGANACLEWLPQESIFFDGALAELRTDIHLRPGARYIGWDILCFGRGGAAQRMRHGHCKMLTRVTSDGKPVFIERGDIEGGSAQFDSPVALGGHSVCGTMLAIASRCDKEMLAACRKYLPERGEGAVSLLPGVLVARYLGDSSESAKHYFMQLRRVLRPAIMDCESTDLRIWST